MREQTSDMTTPHGGPNSSPRRTGERTLPFNTFCARVHVEHDDLPIPRFTNGMVLGHNSSQTRGLCGVWRHGMKICVNICGPGPLLKPHPSGWERTSSSSP
ncbi:hypothetical protein CCUS01_14342 [Colletotrichum cuscutae]|uniref:Uncharacterized protein n=1 Tax=Colletotrichum cuscutae TaxID=1209917 RepID=A0AAI9Y9C5_9PEZI|nr:hypothetical protein CCUS01_14342 [Colletotrichum cuscutae]